MKKILLIVGCFFSLGIVSQIQLPFTDIKTSLDFAIPDEERIEGDTANPKSRGNLNILLVSADFNNIKEVILEAGNAMNNADYLSKTIVVNTVPQNSLVLFEKIKFYRPLMQAWLSVRVKYQNNSFSQKSYIQIQ